MREMLALQREFEAHEARRAYTSALVELKSALPPFLKRDKTVDFDSQKGKVHYTHTSLAGAMETVQPHLTAYGFSLTWRPGTNDKGGVTVTAILTHRQGHSEESTLTAAPDASGGKNSVQAVASTITLLQRYSALAILGLATADMVEPTGEAAPAPEQVDTARNMKAMASLVKGGRTNAAVEKYVGKPVSEWTSKDLDKLRAWATPPENPQPAEETPADPITPQQRGILNALLKEFHLEPAAFADLIAKEIDRRPGSLAKISKAEFGVIVKAFDGLRSGAYSIKNGILDKPPVFDKEVPEDKTIPF